MKTLRADRPAANASKSWGGALFICFGAYSLDMQFPLEGLKLGNLLLVAFCIISVIASWFSRKRLGKRGFLILREDIIFLFYIVFCATSTVWSASPADTIVQCIFFLAVWSAIINLTYISTNDLLILVFRMSIVICGLSLLVAFLSPAVGYQPKPSAGFPEMRGIFFHQQRLGLYASTMFGLFILAWANGHLRYVFNGRKSAALAILLILICMGLALARLFTASAILALTLTYFISKGFIWRYVAFFLLIFVTAWLILDSQALLVALDAAQVDLTLSGRTRVWETSTTIAEMKAWLGWGFASFDSPPLDQFWSGTYRPPSAHNSAVQAWFETGYIGAGILAVLVFSHLRLAPKITIAGKRYSYSLFLVLLTIIASTTGVTYGAKPTTLLCVTLLFLAVEHREYIGNRKGVARRAASTDGNAAVSNYKSPFPANRTSRFAS